MRSSSFSSLLLVCSVATPAFAQAPVADESFNFGAAGTLLGGNGSGAGWLGPWDAGPNNDFAQLASPSFDNVGLRAHMNGAAVPTFRSLDTTQHPDIADSGYYGADGASIWLRFQAQDVTQSVANPYFGGLSLFADNTEELFIGVPWGYQQWGLDTHGAGLFGVAGSNDNVLTSLVCRLDFALAGDRVRLWVNPATTYPTTAADVDVMVPHFVFNRIRLDNGGSGVGSNARFDFDAIRIEKETGAPGTNYCNANANSTGVAASMSATGTALVSANNLVLHCSSMPQNSFCFFLTSLQQGFVQNPGGSAGNLCVAGAIGRYVGPGQIQNSGAGGAVQLAVDLTRHPTPQGLVVVQPGSTWNFTCWYRDAVGGVPTSNFADGLEVDFL
jgi:hypothetical protein